MLDYPQILIRLAQAKTLVYMLKLFGNHLLITAEEGQIMLTIQEALDNTTPTKMRSLYLDAGLTDEDWRYIEARLHYHYLRGADLTENLN